MTVETVIKSFKSKTVNFGLLLAVAGVVQANLHLITDNLTPTQQGWVTMAVGIVVVALRFVTTTPVSEK